MKIIKIYPPIWGFFWIRNVAADESIRGFSLYLGRTQLAFEWSPESVPTYS